MKKLILIALSVLTFSTKAQSLKQEIIKRDNLHYMAGVNISAATSSFVFYKTKRPFLSCLSGFVVGSIAGIAKEAIWDKRMHLGTCDNGAAFTTMWGSLTGSLGARISINIFYEKKQPLIVE